MGDLNDAPFDPSVTIHAGATRELSDVLRARSARLYNLSWQYLAQERVAVAGKTRVVHGTIYYQGDATLFEIGSASSRGRAWQYVSISVVDVTLKTNRRKMRTNM